MTISPTDKLLADVNVRVKAKSTDFGSLPHLEEKGCLMFVLWQYEWVICDVVVVKVGLSWWLDITVLISDSAWLSQTCSGVSIASLTMSDI